MPVHLKMNTTHTGNQKHTTIEGIQRWPGFLDGLWQIVHMGTHDCAVGERTLHAYHTWFRDHIHMIKFARYFDADPVSTLQFLIDNQHPSGFFFEILTPDHDPHLGYVDEQFHRILDARVPWRRQPPPENREQAHWALLRLELEADIEYLMVEGVARAWEATGDTAWMEAALPALERGLQYCLTHPDRFDPVHGLVKRPFTIDTWDFCWGRTTDHRGIDEETPMVIHHGDNAGVSAAAEWLGDRRDSQSISSSWHRQAKDIKTRTHALCWNGRFFTHQILLTPVETGGPPEETILSLSNPYDINRGFTTQEQSASIIREYINLKEQTKELSVSEWFTIYPPYPKFAKHAMWDYVNGGIAPFVGGELATAAFNHGFEWYGVDILDRLFEWWKRDGTLDFLYTKDGKPQGGGPRGWGTAAIGQALLEGMAGVDMHAAENRACLSPRWVSADERDITVDAIYPSSGFRCRYQFKHDPEQHTITLDIQTPGDCDLNILLPDGTSPQHVFINGIEHAYELRMIEQSPYVWIGGIHEAGEMSIVNVLYT